MAFPAGWTRRAPLVIQRAKVTADQTGLPMLITAPGLPGEMVTAGGANAAQSDGGDIRFTSDLAGTTQLACQVVAWTQNAVPASAVVEIWVPVNVLTASDVTIYVWYAAGGGQTQPAANAAFGSQAVWDSNYGAVYHLQTIGAATTGTTPDATVNANTLTNAISNVTAVAGKTGGNAGSFSAASYTLQRSSGFTNIPTGGAVRTLEGWFKLASTSVAQSIFQWGDNGAAGGRFGFYYGNNGWLYAECNAVYSRFLWTADTNWHHLAFSMSTSSTASILGYLDGVPQTMDNTGSTLNTTMGRIQISGIPMTTAAYFNGLLDEARISKSVRSGSWITTGYNNQSNPSTFVIPGTPISPGGAQPQPFVVT